MKRKLVLTLRLLMGPLFAVAQVTPAEKQALQDLYNATNGPNWATETDNFIGDEWDFNGVVTNDWYGVTVANGHVTKLNLEFNDLMGSIPASIGDLVHLTYLNLSTNELTGSIPNEIGNLVGLQRLDLHDNNLSGNLPVTLENLSNLMHLDLALNNIDGPIPPELGNLSNLNTLFLYSNNLDGTIPPEIENLIHLTWLDLSNNNLSGAIPPEIGNLEFLGILSLYNNKLDGAIPVELGDLWQLGALDLSKNELSGAIPPELGNLTILETFNLSNNNLSGPIPPELENFTNLYMLQLEYNQLNGTIPAELGNITSLGFLNISNNKLSGAIPSQLGNLHVDALYLNNNKLSGNIPPELGDIWGLHALNLSSNELVGPIPPELGNSSELWQLDLSSNQLSGSIPPELADIEELENMYLHDNNLENNIPTAITDQSFASLYVANNKLDFGNLEYHHQNYNGNSFAYSPQQKTDQPQAFQIFEGNNITLTTQMSGTQNHYQWYKDGQPINGAADAPNYKIVIATAQDAGTYHCVMTSDIVDNLVLTRHNIDLSVGVSIPGEHPQEENWNIITVWDYDMDTNLKGNTRSYYNCLGKHVQTQSWDPVTHAIWGQATLYDYQGRPALSTLSAPIPGQGQFQHHPALITSEGGETYSAPDFEADPFAPGTVTLDSPLGQYYSGVTSNQYQDVTPYPFSRTVFSDLNPGTTLAVVGGNKVDTNGDNSITPADTWPQAYTFTMPATNELSLNEAFGDANYQNIKTLKTVTRDVHGNETVVFVDTDGKLLATARSGTEGVESQPMSLPIGSQGFVDVHIPKGISGISISNENGITLYNLIADAVEPTSSANLPPGFYRVAVNDLDGYDPNTITVNYRINYYDYSLNEYDGAGRLVAAYQPIEDEKGDPLATVYEYNTLGQLVSKTSPDEGKSNFLYRNDGQIRYSQNNEQQLAEEVSYTDYDRFGRPVESGVLEKTELLGLDPNAPLPQAQKREIMQTTYDFLDNGDNEFLNNLDPGYQHPSFLAGNVAKTANDHATTYYSYDAYGRVMWSVQHIEGLGTKTIEYGYGPLTGLVEKVTYQKGQQDQFVHRYTYNDRDQLKQVETSVDDDTFTLQAHYLYNEAGTLVRTEIADGAQGVDYVYGLSGQLKSINHPSLNPALDPGGDQNDLFGMQLDYHLGDYRRTENTNITTALQGTDRYNGNIKGIRWQTAVNDVQESQYVYSYDRNNWLAGADFDPGASNDNAYDVSNITYDANGNIQTLLRRKGDMVGKTHMDDLTYNYDIKRPNRLTSVDDEMGDVPDADDIGDQNDGNYQYNTIGQLVRNESEDIAYIYNASGLVAEIWHAEEPLLKFFYNDRNQRVKKETYWNNNLVRTQHYVRNVAGQTMAIYTDLALAEQPVYGAGRIGVAYNGINDQKTYIYELTDHLGNVRATFVKVGNEPNIHSWSDYYPGGMPMPGRSVIGNYRYGYQGQFSEKDEETVHNFFERRLYDPRILRWLRPDDVRRTSQSPYMAMGNNPILYGDPDGRDVIILNSSMAVGGLGHAAVLIGNDKDGWRYLSKNGTDKNLGTSFGLSGPNRNPDLGNREYNALTGKGTDFRGTGLNASQVIQIVNNQYREAHPDGERYDNFIRLETSAEEDEIAYDAAFTQANGYFYDVCGSSCVDVPQDALKALGRFKTPDIESSYNNILPNRWFINFGWHNNNTRYNRVPYIEVGQGHFGAPLDD
ncbi:hypothetical protein KIM67_17965 [Flagellimonas sp. 389]|uniref:leucine-rich repeat domain-containing protein n=1 Tax=Flagellimonas sp. 389 TaxID=2835862 RepID=UPI001BD3A4D8|nr:RHS repeat-associated core domain-containing protein [Flagellimonas sp. 389]MBS9464315.1 hypothetical protein [Flagellimonas sp. 389]